ncbi:Tryptophan--tRNA ligase, mitochondrial [Armadillidium vulgare]|nr:Tryptophan--tRNA ligase, mitochondrial [Armadillidium vulgare]
MKLLNDRYNYGLKLVLLSIDEGITGYRDDSLETVKRNEVQYGIPLKILSYDELYGWTMDRIVEKIGRKNNCTFCGVFRRQALDRGAELLKVDKIVTGHNADDIAETVIMNILRGDIARLQRCTSIQTSSEDKISRCKPFKYTYEKEIVMYAYFKKLDYFTTECESLAIRDGIHLPAQTTCSRCGHVSSQEICKACVLLEGLNNGIPKLGIGKSSKVKEKLKISKEKNGNCANCSCSKKEENGISSRLKDIEELLNIEVDINGSKSCRNINKVTRRIEDLSF